MSSSHEQPRPVASAKPGRWMQLSWLIAIAGCSQSEPSLPADTNHTAEPNWLEVEIIPKARRPVLPLPVPDLPRTAHELDDDALYTNVYNVPPTFLSSPRGSSDVIDPFARDSAGEASPYQPPRTARQVLEEAGIEFPEGAAVMTGGPTSQLIVRNTLRNLALVESYLETITQSLPERIDLQLYLFSLEASPSPAEGGTSHDLADFQTVLEQVRQGNARYLDGAIAAGTSDRRGRTSAGQELIAYHGLHTDEATGNQVPTWETYEAGLIFEFDTVMRGDRYTVDLSYSLRYDYAPPAFASVEVPARDGAPPTVVQQPHFRKVERQGEVIVEPGDVVLLGSWNLSAEVTGDAPLHLVAFVQVDVHPLFETADPEEEK